MKKTSLVLGMFVALGLLSGCSSTKETIENPTAEQVYNQAYELLERTSYKKAAETFEKVEMEHPYSKWATQAKIMSAYAYYKDKDYDSAIINIDRFIKFHPGNKDIAYAYYLKALCYYDQIAPVEKDQSNSERALEAFRQVVIRFPNTEYAKDAEFKMALASDHLAGHEMEIGRYYLSQENYLSALNRFSGVVNNYQTTTHIEEALYLRAVEIHGKNSVCACCCDKIGNELCGDRISCLSLSVLTGIAHVRDNRCDTACGSSLECIDHNEKLHEVVVYRAAQRLNNENVRASDTFLNGNADLAVRECNDL